MLQNAVLCLMISAVGLTWVVPSSFAAAPCTQTANTQIKMEKSSAQIPDPIKKPPNVIPLGCERPFIYKGETYSADSPQAQDASTLKEFVQTVPEANSILEDYQSNRSKSKLSAYTGTVGLLMAILAGPISKQFNSNSQASVRTALQVGGLAIAAGGFFYSFTLLRTNEYLLPKAVDAYNQAKPDDGIELRFTTGWTF
jgi:hypothetical protein